MKVQVFAAMFAPDFTLLDKTVIEVDDSWLADPIRKSILTERLGLRMKRPEGLNDVHLVLSLYRHPTSEEMRIARTTRGPDSVIVSV